MTDIDLVIPMVFPYDPEWQRKYAQHHSNDATKHVRFRSWGTEHLLVRCCIKYMPWLRCIHILLAGESQVQPWMRAIAENREARWQEDLSAKPQGAGQPVVRVVFHRDFIPEKYLPCFASPCIEMFLHRIPGLSERFIYANDDMFPLSPLDPEDFFRDGLPCQLIAERTYPEKPSTFQRKCMWQQNMIGKPFGKHFTKTYPDTGHIFSSILKSSCEEVWRKHGKEITKYLSPLGRTDHSANNWIYLLYQQYAGLCVAHRPTRHYTDQKTATTKIVEIIRDPQAGIVCINDNEKIKDWETKAAIVRREIEKKLCTAELRNVLTIAVIHYNTPKLLRASVLSLWKHTPGCRVVIFDNSDKLTIAGCRQWDTLRWDPLVTVIDNTKGQVVDFGKMLEQYPEREFSDRNKSNFGSAKHTASVDKLFDLLPDGFLLMDSDVLFTRDVSCLVDRSIAATGTLKPNGGVMRLLPLLCWLNVPMLREHGIRYFNGEKMWALSQRYPENRYDTGAWVLEEIQRCDLPIREVNAKDYLLHLGHGSWRIKKPMAWVKEHRDLWE